MVAEIVGVGIERAQLFKRSLDYFWMAVPHVGHIVAGVEVAFPCLIKQILHFPSDDVDRVRVAQRQVAAGDLSSFLLLS
jgi:hypothetical protein